MFGAVHVKMLIVLLNKTVDSKCEERKRVRLLLRQRYLRGKQSPVTGSFGTPSGMTEPCFIVNSKNGKV
jgi:hypothetical protein